MKHGCCNDKACTPVKIIYRNHGGHLVIMAKDGIEFTLLSLPGIITLADYMTDAAWLPTWSLLVILIAWRIAS